MNPWDAVIKEVKFDDNGLVTAIAVDKNYGDIVMLAYMNREALRITLETNTMTYWSRSRKKLWLKGESSGNIQKVVSVRIDCDGDALLFEVEPQGLGAACHVGYRSCFYRELQENKWVIGTNKPLFDPKDVYQK